MIFGSALDLQMHTLRQKRFLTFSVVVLLAVITCFEVEAEQTELRRDQGQLLLPRYGLSAVTDGQFAYVYGGAPNGGRNGEAFMHDGLLPSIEKIDPNTLTAEYFSSGLYRRANHASVFSGNKLISCGGRTQHGLSRSRISECETLDIDSGILRKFPALPVAARTLGLAEIDGYIYASGGVLDGPAYSSGTFRISTHGGKWERLPDAPLKFSGSIIPIDRKLYVLGGYNGDAMHSVMVFDTNSKKWELLHDLPRPLSAYSAVADRQSIFIFGDYVMMDKIHRYDIETGKLYLLEQTMTPRRHTAAVVVQGRALVFGGNQSSSGESLRVVEAFDMNSLRAEQGVVVSINR